MKKHLSSDGVSQESLFSFDEIEACNPASLFGKDFAKGPVTCLGIEFADDDARRAYFRDRLREKLPELRHIEGFPIGSDDDIINLSDPPYYTACPNPWLNDFIAEWETEKQQLEAEGKRRPDFEVTEPYAYPIREKKNNPIYVAHSYHTKVPPEVVLNYYLHYTQPGDIVIDNFAGTGMAGVAAKLCESPSAALQERVNNNWKGLFGHKPSWGRRFSILGDLSPIASNIAYNYNSYVDSLQFEKIANAIVKQLEDELGYTYDFVDENGNQGVINYVVWSEKQVCPNCGEVFTYWDQAVDIEKNIQRSSYQCPSCGNEITKRNSQKSFETHFDEVIGDSIKDVAFEPVFVNYSVNKKRFERELNRSQRDSMLAIQSDLSIASAPCKSIPKGDETERLKLMGISHMHQFYTRRNLAIIVRFKQLIESCECDGRMKLFLGAWFTSSLSRLHIMNRYAPNHHRHVGPLANTYYISGTPTEISPFYFIKSKIKENCVEIANANSVVNQIASATNVSIADESVDYIFTDPPFGANIMYSELNFILESWLGVRTNNTTEAISNKTQNKGVFEYLQIMTDCFK